MMYPAVLGPTKANITPTSDRKAERNDMEFLGLRDRARSSTTSLDAMKELELSKICHVNSVITEMERQSDTTVMSVLAIFASCDCLLLQHLFISNKDPKEPQIYRRAYFMLAPSSM